MRVHKEGYTIITIAFFLILAIDLICYFTIGKIGLYIILAPSLFGLAFILRFFRVPKRNPEIKSNCIYSPADGEIVTIEEVEETEFLKAKCIQVSVFMSVWNVHINWIPFSGTIKYFKYHPGNFFLAWHPKSSTHNERTSIAVERKDGMTVMIRQIAGFVARRIICYAKEGNSVTQSQQLGFIKFGSRVDLFLPLDSDIKVQLNQKVKGIQTIIAEVKGRV
ncbi:MAG: phosphatidylserine decarboxylase family protein [Bacteroidales bacterium]|nr:MAG: phosphatidylserine decarboxylase family protein [Bacteroidales bacterium]